MGGGEITDQDVENARGAPPQGTSWRPASVAWNESRWPRGGGSRVTQPGYHSTGVPPSSPAQKPASPHGSGASSTISRIQPATPQFSSSTSP